MSTHQTASRTAEDDQAIQELKTLKAQHAKVHAGDAAEEIEIAENLELPGADVNDDNLALDILPKQLDEFTCTKCFLVHHRSQLDHESALGPVCSDCS